MNASRTIPRQNTYGLSLSEKLDFYSIPEPNSGCLLWLGAVRREGWHGVLRWAGKVDGAHRLAWVEARGPIPGNLHVLHKCDNPACINVDHLFLGAHAENMGDMAEKGRSPRGESQPSAKLSRESVMAIRRDPRSALEIAEQYAVSVPNVYLIKARKTWAHLGAEGV